MLDTLQSLMSLMNVQNIASKTLVHYQCHNDGNVGLVGTYRKGTPAERVRLLKFPCPETLRARTRIAGRLYAWNGERAGVYGILGPCPGCSGVSDSSEQPGSWELGAESRGGGALLCWVRWVTPCRPLWPLATLADGRLLDCTVSTDRCLPAPHPTASHHHHHQTHTHTVPCLLHRSLDFALALFLSLSLCLCPLLSYHSFDTDTECTQTDTLIATVSSSVGPGPHCRNSPYSPPCFPTLPCNVSPPLPCPDSRSQLPSLHVIHTCSLFASPTLHSNTFTITNRPRDISRATTT